MHFTSIFVFVLLTALCNGDIPCNKFKTESGYICVCNSTYCDTIITPKKLPVGQFHFYYTSDYSPGFNHETSHFREPPIYYYGKCTKYEVNINNTFQKIRGFGGTFTDSFGISFNTLSYDTQENLLKSLFSEDGIEYTMCRVVLGSSDFSVKNYSYIAKYDPSMKTFNLTEDDYIYKIFQIRRSLNITKRKINLYGSAWSSPSWMKSNKNFFYGYLRPEFLQLYADYYIKILDAFRNEGIEFWGLTTGNEPITLYIAKAIPSVSMFPEEQREWIINNLGPALKKANYSTKVIIMDDFRFFALWYMNTVMRDPRAKQYVTGIGIHWYSDFLNLPTPLDKIHEKFPDQEIFYTESSINFEFSSPSKMSNSAGGIITEITRALPLLGSWKRAAFYAADIIENLQHWVTTYTDWNLALDLDGGPNILPNLTCDASIIINKTANEFYKQPLHYVLGHFSKFILPGAVIFDVHSVADIKSQNLNFPFNSTTILSPFQIFSKNYADIQYIGAANPDGSFTIIFHNLRDFPQQILVHDPNRGHAFLFLDPNSISTLLYW
ncbi:putative glucosylceramidase 4 [Lycorma delicatula]|uniref:putative glucosylceramidase 4 n=1 Tax=Lycorma delicatula TaxID=130591 RepID=UPI003F50FE2B